MGRSSTPGIPELPAMTRVPCQGLEDMGLVFFKALRAFSKPSGSHIYTPLSYFQPIRGWGRHQAEVLGIHYFLKQETLLSSFGNNE